MARPHGAKVAGMEALTPPKHNGSAGRFENTFSRRPTSRGGGSQNVFGQQTSELEFSGSVQTLPGMVAAETPPDQIKKKPRACHGHGVEK